jgi:hypothetical protein
MVPQQHCALIVMSSFLNAQHKGGKGQFVGPVWMDSEPGMPTFNCHTVPVSSNKPTVLHSFWQTAGVCHVV